MSLDPIEYVDAVYLMLMMIMEYFFLYITNEHYDDQWCKSR